MQGRARGHHIVHQHNSLAPHTLCQERIDGERIHHRAQSVFAVQQAQRGGIFDAQQHSRRQFLCVEGPRQYQRLVVTPRA